MNLILRLHGHAQQPGRWQPKGVTDKLQLRKQTRVARDGDPTIDRIAAMNAILAKLG
jgi:hypothetical protein